MQAYSQATETFECPECASTSCMHYGPRMVHYHEPRAVSAEYQTTRSPQHGETRNRKLPPPGTPVPVIDLRVIGNAAHYHSPRKGSPYPGSVPLVMAGWRLDMSDAMPVRIRVSRKHRLQNQIWVRVLCSLCGRGEELIASRYRRGTREVVCPCENANMRPRRQALRGLESVR